MKYCTACNAKYDDSVSFCSVDGEVLEADPASIVNTVLDGQYQMEALLGKGGMGAVYRARHILLGDRVAIKVLPPEVRNNAEWLRRFRREGQAARRFRHNNAVTVYDPDAPTGSGFWHWVIYDIPSNCTFLAPDAGAEGSPLKPAEAKEASNDAGFRGYVGAAPPAGHGPHRYYFRVHALDVPSLELPDDASPAIVGFGIWQHSIAQGEAMVTYEVPA